MSETRREHILNELCDTVSRLLYYDRKEDEDLPRGAIEAAVSSGEITTEEMVECFARHLREGMKP
jgi:hypothetical protein